MADRGKGTEYITELIYDGRHGALDDFYRTVPRDCGFRIYLPTRNEQKDTYDKNRPYVLLFLKENDVADPVMSIWQKMVHSREDIGEINLIYDTSAPGVSCA